MEGRSSRNSNCGKTPSIPDGNILDKKQLRVRSRSCFYVFHNSIHVFSEFPFEYPAEACDAFIDQFGP